MSSDTGGSGSRATAQHRNPDWLRRMVSEERLTYEEMADRAGVSRGTIWSWIDRHDLHTELRIEKICIRLGIPEDDRQHAHAVDEYAEEHRLWRGVIADVRAAASVFGAAGQMDIEVTIRDVQRAVSSPYRGVKTEIIREAVERLVLEAEEETPVEPPVFNGGDDDAR